MAPARTPKDTVARLSGLFAAAMRAPEVQAKLAPQGLYPVDSVHMRRQYEEYGRVIQATATERGMLVLNAALGKAPAAKLGSNPVVLMRGHGETVVGRSVEEATVRTLYINIDARAQAAAKAMGTDLVALDDAELATNARENFDADRPWENYRQRMLKAQAQQR